MISTDSGTTIIATSVTRQLRRKPNTTSAAKTSPIRIASSTALIEERTSCGLVVPFVQLDRFRLGLHERREALLDRLAARLSESALSC